MTTFLHHHFKVAGWSSGRSLPIASIVPMNHPAAAVLQEFGGLTVGIEEAGEECARTTVTFCSVELDAEIVRWQGLLSTHLVGVAHVSGGHADLFLAADGRCFGRSCVHDAFYFEGSDFYEAIERIVRGQRAQPMLRPDQDSVSLYGEVFRRGDAALYDY
ncbi:MAG TPA: hypothetical protein DCY13_11710 [Verrucomicrobiales bacterium]|nr:hypothetical protein [Verrucomicrobiales bacterium]